MGDTIPQFLVGLGAKRHGGLEGEDWILSLGVNRFVPGYQVQLSRQIKSTKKHIHKHGNARHKQNSTDAQAVQRMLTYLKLAVA